LPGCVVEAEVGFADVAGDDFQVLGGQLTEVTEQLLVLGSASGTRDRTYIRQRTVQVLVPISKSGVWPLWPIMPEHAVA
jgi:hypothetical protein